MKRPTVIVVTRRTARRSRHIEYVGEAHLELLLKLKIFPLIVPSVSGVLPLLTQYREKMRGLLLVEGEDIEPRRYVAQEANLKYLEKTDPEKDEVELRLLRYALKRRIPVLGICRGCQLLNIVNGGTLFGDVKEEKGSPLKHISHDEHYDDYRHRVTVLPDTPLARWYGEPTLSVNSYHHQGVQKLAKRFVAMAHADDGLIEAYYDPQERFLVGLQFHPERMLPEYEGNWRAWQAFAKAVHATV